MTDTPSLRDSALFGPALARLAAGIAAIVPEARAGGLDARLEALEAALVRLESLPERVVPLGDRVLALTAAGARIFLDAGDTAITPHIALTGTWEPGVERALRRLLRPGQSVVEIGANMGYHTLVMAEAIGPTGRLHAFEAHPRTAGLLAATLAINGLIDRVTLHPLAALDRAGTVSFAEHPTLCGSFHLADAETGADFTARLAIPAVTLDEELADLPAIDLLRIDAEGSEPLALRGAVALLARSPALVLMTEWSPVQMASRADVAGFADWLLGQGLAPGRILPDGGLAPLHRDALLALDHADLVFLRQR